MKLLDNSKLDSIVRHLNGDDNFDSCNQLSCRIEMYSCKMTSENKRDYKEMCRNNKEGESPASKLEALSPPQVSPMPEIDEKNIKVVEHVSSASSLSDLESIHNISGTEEKNVLTYDNELKNLFFWEGGRL